MGFAIKTNLPFLKQTESECRVSPFSSAGGWKQVWGCKLLITSHSLQHIQGLIVTCVVNSDQKVLAASSYIS